MAAALLLALLSLGLGCTHLFPRLESYEYFASPDPHDPWSPKISGWQRRQRADRGDASVSVPAVAEAGARAEQSEVEGAELRAKYSSFKAERRREIASHFADWIQNQAKRHYIADGPLDHWATLEETLSRDGDDCDGLELLVFRALRDLGFAEDEVFRAIVYRPEDGQHHMVTLWFEDEHDPWVIDPTGAMVAGMRRMSDIPGWVPLKIFSDESEYSVEPLPLRNANTAALASNP